MTYNFQISMGDCHLINLLTRNNLYKSHPIYRDSGNFFFFHINVRSGHSFFRLAYKAYKNIELKETTYIKAKYLRGINRLYEFNLCLTETRMQLIYVTRNPDIIDLKTIKFN